MSDYDFEPMTDDELDSLLDECADTPLADLAQRGKDLYKRLRASIAEDEIPDTFKHHIKQMDMSTPTTAHGQQASDENEE